MPSYHSSSHFCDENEPLGIFSVQGLSSSNDQVMRRRNALPSINQLGSRMTCPNEEEELEDPDWTRIGALLITAYGLLPVTQ